MLLVPPPPGPSRPAAWTDVVDGVGSPPPLPPPTGNATNSTLLVASPAWLDLAKLPAVFPVDSSSPELFFLGPEDRLLSRQEAAGLRYAVMDVPGGPRQGARLGAPGPGPRGGGAESAALGAAGEGHKILRGDRRMYSGESGQSPSAAPPPTPQQPLPPPPSARTAPGAITATTTARSSSGWSFARPSPPPSRAPSRPTPGGPGRAAPLAAPLAVDRCVASGGSPLFVREEDTRVLIEDSVRQVVQTALHRCNGLENATKVETEDAYCVLK